MAPSPSNFTPRDMVVGISSVNGDLIVPSMQIWRRASDLPIQVQYFVRNPLNELVFEAIDNVGNNWISVAPGLVHNGSTPFTLNFTRSRGILSDNSVSPTRMNFRNDGLVLGTYTTTVRVRYFEDNQYKVKELIGTFEVRNERDIVVTNIFTPESYQDLSTVYPYINTVIPFRIEFQNVGKNPVDAFVVTFSLTNSSNN